MAARPQPRRTQPRAHTAISCRVSDAQKFRTIVAETGLRHDAAFHALVRLFDLCSLEARRDAGFPLPREAGHDARLTPASAHDARNTTREAAA